MTLSFGIAREQGFETAQRVRSVSGFDDPRLLFELED